MPQKPVRKEIKVITVQNTIKGQKQNGFPMRKWKISLQGLSSNGDPEPMPYVDYVEYILHESFAQPVRKVTEYPFALQEKGWGEFDMKIMLHFTDKSVPPVALDHDLNFQSSQYESAHTLTFKPDVKASFLKLLTAKRASPSSDRESSSDSHEEPSSKPKRRRDAPVKERSKRVKDESSEDDSLADSSNAASGDEWGDKVDVHQLAKRFQLLQEEDLAELVQLVKDHQTADMYVQEDGDAGEFHIDLRTLGDELLTILWQFCDKKLERDQSD
ncbi:hypothetical protein BGZ83_004753 [Gryganskiella cystojenkinii]|nr:hypothetical protein BGZ83_004753 [Gryganskiella cystojenkinii]